MPQGTITHMQADGDWTSSSGKQFFQFEITLDGNVSGQVNAISSEPWFDIGMMVEYEVAGQSPRGDTKLKIRKLGSDYASNPPEKANVPAYPKNFVQDNKRQQEVRKAWAIKTAAIIYGPQPDLTQRQQLDYAKGLVPMAQCLLLALDQMD